MRHIVRTIVVAAIVSSATAALAADGPPYAGAKDDATYSAGFDQVPRGAPLMVARNPAFDDAGYAANAPAELRTEAVATADASPFAAAHDDAGAANAAPVAPRATAGGRDEKPTVAGCPCCDPCSHHA